MLTIKEPELHTSMWVNLTNTVLYKNKTKKSKLLKTIEDDNICMEFRVGQNDTLYLCSYELHRLCGRAFIKIGMDPRGSSVSKRVIASGEGKEWGWEKSSEVFNCMCIALFSI